MASSGMTVKRDQIYLSATQKDAPAALSLMEGLENFRVPRTLEVAPEFEALARNRRVMRHGQENPRIAKLPDLVREKLGESAVMVLVCSSSASTSRWIHAEVEEFYRTHPRGPIVPVVLDGEPNPEESVRVFEKPCFPENLKKADLERWVDARRTDWAETAPVATLAALMGVRVEQLIHHEALLARRMRRQRGISVALLATALVMMVGWMLRWSLHDAAERTVPGYEARWGDGMERWLSRAEGRGGRANAPATPEVHRSRPVTGRAAPASNSSPERAQPDEAEGPAAEETEEPSFLESLPQEDPVAFQMALNAWLDEAERYLPDELDEAERWIGKAKRGLEDAKETDYGNELYRVHALSAVIAQRRRNSELSRSELVKAVEYWISIPIQNLADREQEGLNILTTIAPTAEWRQSAVKLAEWLTTLPGDEARVSRRAGRLIDLVEVHAYLAPVVEGWLGDAVEQMSPPPQDVVATSAKFTMLQADFVRSLGKDDEAVEILTSGAEELAADAKEDSRLHQALLSQFRYRKSALSGEAVRSEAVEEQMENMQSATGMSGWEGWFEEDLRSGWGRLGDLQLREDSFREAIESYNRALEFSESPEELAGILLKSGCAYRYDGDAAGAWDAFSLAIPIFEEAGDENSLLTAVWGAVFAARDLQRPREGRQLQQRARKLQAKLGASYQPPNYWREPISPVEFTDAESPAAQTAQVSPSSAAEAEGTEDDEAPAPSVASIQSPQELEARIVTVQRKIADLEASSENRRTFRGLEELQDLYAELDLLLRKKLTSKANR